MQLKPTPVSIGDESLDLTGRAFSAVQGSNEPSELLLLLQTHRCWRLCPANPHFQSCSWGHWFLEQPMDRCEFPSWIKVPGVLNPQATHTPPLSNKKKITWISCYNLHGGPAFFRLPQKKLYSHQKWCLSLEEPFFLKNQASWMYYNLNSLMGSRNVMILYIICFCVCMC